VIRFTEPPDAQLSFVKVLNSAGRDVESGPSGSVPGQPAQLAVALQPSLPDGVYTITWRTVSRADGHVTGGSLTFGVGVAPGGPQTVNVPPSQSASAPSALAVAGRWAFYWGLALLVGGGVFASALVRALPPAGRRLLAGSWLLAAAGLVAMVAAERAAVGVPLGTLLGSQAGEEFIHRGIALAVVGAAVIQAVANPRWTSLVWVAVAGAGAMLAHVLAGHAGAVSGTAPRWFDIGVQWLHLVAVGVWVGGLAWLLLALRGLTGDERADVVRRFSFVAGISLAAVAVTGAIRAISELGWRHLAFGLLHTSFGLTLAVKVGLFAGLIALGARNRYVNVPGVASGQRPVGSLGRTVGAEILVAAGILGATGVLSGLPPAASLAAAATEQARPARAVLRGVDETTVERIQTTVVSGEPTLFTISLPSASLREKGPEGEVDANRPSWWSRPRPRPSRSVVSASPGRRGRRIPRPPD